MSAAAPGHTERECPRCGARFYRRRGKPTGRCPDCAFEVFASVVKQHREKAGPIYEKVVRGQLRYWSAEAKRIGVDAA